MSQSITPAAARPKRSPKASKKLKQIQEDEKALRLLTSTEPVSSSDRNSSLGGTSRALSTGQTSSSGSSDRGSSSPRTSIAPSTANMPHVASDNGRVRALPTRLPDFGPDQLIIYSWQMPRPTDFLNLSESRKAWKRRVDEQERAADFDDGSDDWYDFAGDREMYSQDSRGISKMGYCIANAFVHRAKRAFWAGKAWQEFEFAERMVDSEAQARAERDPNKRRILLEDALDNKLRLDVFDAIKQRLCEEIWLEPYHELPLDGPYAKRDSKVSDLDDTAGESKQILPPTAVESKDGVVGWGIDQYGHAQPLYGDEKEVPNGMANFMRDMRAAEQYEAQNMRPPSATGNQPLPDKGAAQARIGNIGVNGLLGMTATQEIASRPLDFSDSDVEEQ